MTREISVSEWLTELTKATARTPDGAMTVVELAAQMDRSTEWMRNKLKSLASAGDIALNPVRVLRPAMDGTTRPTTAYRITRTKKPAK